MRYYYTHDRSDRWYPCEGASLMAAKQEATKAMYSAGAQSARVAREPEPGSTLVPVAARKASSTKWEPAL